MENQIKAKTRVKHPDRITLSPEALKKVEAWVKEVETRHQGVHLTKSNIVDFLLLSRSPELSESELKEIVALHYDEVRFLAWALKQIRVAKAQGRVLTLESIVSTNGRHTVD